MINAVSNQKYIEDGYLVYRMLRVVGGVAYGYQVMVTLIELKRSRLAVARTIWRARQHLRAEIERLAAPV